MRASDYDLIVIGAGINGAAIAREAALSGNSVLLLERDDPGCGTSAASTRLIHGGLRYLEHAEFSLVRESLAERERLLAMAPHLVEPLHLYLPLYKHARRKLWQIRAGMWLYDLLSFDKSLPRHRIYGRRELLEHLPALAPDGLVGGASYFDAQIRFPERLVVENIQDAVANGTELHTQAPVTRILVEAGHVIGVSWRCRGEARNSTARVVVNAAGPWVDSVLDAIASAPLIGGTKGSHLVVAPFNGAPKHAVYAEAASDGRPFFVIPWNGQYLIGTTDERYRGDPAAVSTSRAEFDYLVAETRALFPLADDLEDRVLYTQAGVRPLPNRSTTNTGAVTRRHIIRRHRNARGLYSIIGGKLTTHRALAVDVMRRLRRRLHTESVSPTAQRPLPGSLAAQDRDQLLGDLKAQFGPVRASRLWGTYGAAAAAIAARARESGELAATIGDSDLLGAELLHAKEHEYAITLIDILQRRTMVGLDDDFGLSIAPAAATAMVELGIWDRAGADQEVQSYRQYAQRFGRPARVNPSGSR